MSGKPTPNNLISFPSVSYALHSLPQATSISNVALHPNMYAQRAAESHAKLQKAINKSQSQSQHPLSNASSAPAAGSYMVTSNDSSSHLMMRSKSKFTIS